MIYLGTQEIKKVFLGSTPVKKIYKGAQLVWQAISLLQAFINRVNLDGGTYYENGAAAGIDETASLVLIPSAVKAGKLYSILPEDGSGDFTVERNSTAFRKNAQGILEVVPANVARIDYSTGEPMLLVEGQASNFLRYSNELLQLQKDGTGALPAETKWIQAPGEINYGQDKMTAANNFTDAPDGTQIDGYVFENVAVYQDVSVGTTVKDFTSSIWVKTNIPGIFGFRKPSGGSNTEDNVDIEIGVEWQRIEVSALKPETLSVVRFLIDGRAMPAKLLNYSKIGRILWVWNGQVEEGGIATSVIPTTGSTITRLSDYITVPTPPGVTQIKETIQRNTQILNEIPNSYQLPIGAINKIEML